jgi:hypothetical protein
MHEGTMGCINYGLAGYAPWGAFWFYVFLMGCGCGPGLFWHALDSVNGALLFFLLVIFFFGPHAQDGPTQTNGLNFML